MSTEKLKTITKEALEASGKYEETDTFFAITLDDYDWMDYKLSTIFHVEPSQGRLEVTFEYSGFIESWMTVIQQINGKTYQHRYWYSTDLFKEEVCRYLCKHMESWNTTYAFFGEDLAIEFFNKVIVNHTKWECEEVKENG